MCLPVSLQFYLNNKSLKYRLLTLQLLFLTWTPKATNGARNNVPLLLSLAIINANHLPSTKTTWPFC